MTDPNPDLVAYGSYRGRKITAFREYYGGIYQNTNCTADFDDYDLGDLRGNGSTPQEALDDLLEKCEVHDDGRVVSTEEFTNDPRDQAAICWTRL